MIEMIIFDCDGVLINTEEILLKTEIDFVQSYTGFKIDIEDYVSKHTGLAEDLWVESIYKMQNPATARKVSQESLERFKNDISVITDKLVAPIEGVENFLSGLSVPIAVASNSTKDNLVYKLEKTGLMRFFNGHIFSGDMVERGKPAPDIFLHVARTMNIDHGKCVVVEDSSNGIMAAKAAGMKAIGFLGGGHCQKSHKDVLIRSGADGIMQSYLDPLDKRISAWFMQE